MSTNLEIISDALRDINVIAETQTATAEQGTHGLRKLNQLMELLREQDVEIGYFAQTSTTDTCPIPDWSEMAIMGALSVIMAPKYSASVSMELASVIDNTVTALMSKSIREKRTNADMSHLPQGRGKWNYRNRSILNDT